MFDAQTGRPAQIKDLRSHSATNGWKTYSLRGTGIAANEVATLIDNGVKPTVQLWTESGRTVIATGNHPLLTPTGWTRLDTLRTGDRVAVPAYLPAPNAPTSRPANQISAAARLLVSSESDAASTKETSNDGVPDWLWTLPNTDLQWFFAELFSHIPRDSSANDHVVCVRSAQVARHLQMLLLRLRTHAVISPADGDDTSDRGAPWMVTLRHLPQADGLSVANVGHDGEISVESPASPVDMFWDKVDRVEITGDHERVFDLEVPNCRNYVASGIVVHNSTAALLAASVLAEETGERVALVDANFAQSSQSLLLSLRGQSPTIADVATPPFEAQRLKRSLVTVPNSNLDVLLSPPKIRRADPRVLNPDLWTRCVTQMRDWYRYIIVDTEVAKVLGEPMFDRFVFQVVDQLVAVVAPGEAVTNNIVWLESVTDPHVAAGQNLPLSQIHVLLNMARDGVGWDEPDVKEMFARFGWLGAIPFADEVQRAANDSRLHLSQSDARNAMMQSLFRLTGHPALDRPGKPTVVNRRSRQGGFFEKLLRSN